MKKNIIITLAVIFILSSVLYIVDYTTKVEAHGEYQFLDRHGNRFLYLDNYTEELLELVKDKEFQKVGVKAEWAQYTHNGNIMYISLNGKLQEIDADKKITDIIGEEYSVGVWFFIHPSERYIAYHKKLYVDNYRDEWQGIDIAVYDTLTKTEKILFSNGKTNVINGWVGKELLVEFFDGIKSDTTNFKLLDINGNIREDSRFNNIPRSWTQPLPDPDNKWLVFETNDGVNLVSLKNGNWGSLGFGTKEPKWTKDGLVVENMGDKVNINFVNGNPIALTKTGKPIRPKTPSEKPTF